MTHETTSALQHERCHKRLRVFLGGGLVADSTRAELVWEHPHYPTYWFPDADIQAELVPSDEPHLFDVRLGSRIAPRAARRQAPSPVAALREHIRLEWAAMDAWFEEEEEVFVHAHDPYKRIDILPSSRHIVMSLGGVELASSRRPTLVFETGAPIRYYLPKTDVRMDLLEPNDTRTGCAYKGFARYWDLRLEDRTEEKIAWSYPTPLADAAKLANLIAFNDERVEVLIDGKAPLG